MKIFIPVCCLWYKAALVPEKQIASKPHLEISSVQEGLRLMNLPIIPMKITINTAIIKHPDKTEANFAAYLLIFSNVFKIFLA
ncbi:MAG: hypothetical protein WC159_07810 [Sphaerochaetaceae bacterium]